MYSTWEEGGLFFELVDLFCPDFLVCIPVENFLMFIYRELYWLCQHGNYLPGV